MREKSAENTDGEILRNIEDDEEWIISIEERGMSRRGSSPPQDIYRMLLTKNPWHH